jgi:hypothetical protein
LVYVLLGIVNRKVAGTSYLVSGGDFAKGDNAYKL